MSSIKECPFCNLGERVLVENDHANLFLSNPRKVEGHVLVAPKRHIEKPWEMSDDELIAVFSLIKVAQHRLIAEFGGGTDVKQNYQPFMKQGRVKVDHTHYHIYYCHLVPVHMDFTTKHNSLISSAWQNTVNESQKANLQSGVAIDSKAKKARIVT